MSKYTYHIIAIIFSVILSSIINKLFLDKLLDIFSIMSYFSLLATRVAISLLIYTIIEAFIINKNYQFNYFVNRAFFIYLIWLLGLLFGRIPSSKNFYIKNRFNFESFIPKWVNILHNKLVLYYLLGNLLVYIPFGMFLSYYFKTTKSIVYLIITILFIEILQAITKLGYFDIDDIFLNCIGGLFGILFVSTFKYLFKKQ